MFDCVQVLNKVNAGLVIIDAQQKIVFWNEKIEQMSNINSQNAIGCMLTEICPKFAEQKYQDMLLAAISKGQNRYCSSTLHKAFIYPENIVDKSYIRQNLWVNPIADHDKINYLVLEINDITEHIKNEKKLKTEIETLRVGYQKVKESEKVNSKLARYDSLTNLYNKKTFLQKVNSIINNSELESKSFALLFLDVDGFKQVNDKYGHLCGDVLLQQVAGRLKNNFRSTDIICRMGGDEFMIAVTDIIEKNIIEKITEKLVEVIRKPFNIDNTKICITTSIGVSLFPDDAQTIEILIKLADTAMYKAKQNGKNRYSFIS